MGEMVERVAKALAAAEWPHATLQAQKHWADTHWQKHVPKARVAIDALREISEDLRNRMDAHARNGFVNWDDYHHAMINAVLGSER